MKTKVFCTLGPASLNKNFLKFCKNKISLLRLNMSHIEIKDFSKIIKFVQKNSDIPICIDTEGAQIRSKVNKKMMLKTNQVCLIHRKKNKFNLYPQAVYNKLKKNDILDIGFDGLKLKVVNIKKNFIKSKTISSGILENNKGIHLTNRKIKLNFLTDKDLEGIKLAKKMKIKNFALSFINSSKDIIKFDKLLPTSRKIFKIETLSAIKNINDIFKIGKEFLIDRGDLSKEISVEKIPLIQKKILIKAKKQRRKVYVATNFLESMVVKPIPTVGETNDIFCSLESGASGLVLAAETAIGKHPKKCISFLKKTISVFTKQK